MKKGYLRVEFTEKKGGRKRLSQKRGFRVHRGETCTPGIGTNNNKRSETFFDFIPLSSVYIFYSEKSARIV